MKAQVFIPGNSLTTNWGVMNALFGISRIQFESTNPFWCTEFTTMTAVPNSIRKSAYATLMYGNQMVCGWTWQSMWAGEEQYLEGMLDWDGIPNRKYYEYKKIATEFKKIEKFFPYKPQAEVGLAFSFPSQIASNYFPEKHDEQLQACFNLFYYRNMDARVVEISRSSLNYKLLFVPGVAVMDETTAAKIREFVKNGGTVVMTSNSAIVDEHGQVFASTHPGRLSDVFGIRVGSYEETEQLNEISRKLYKGKKIEFNYKGKVINTESSRFDVIDPKGAEVLGSITSLDKDYPIITSNKYGKGRAIYLLNEQVGLGFQFILTACMAMGLDSRWLGRLVDRKAIDELKVINRKYGVSLVFEGGEAETYVIDAPIFRKKVRIAEARPTWKGASGHLEIIRANLTEKLA